MFQRRKQPPINASLRDTEHHGFQIGFIVVIIGVVLVLSGARHVTAIDTVDGSSATEKELVKAFSSGGLKFPSKEPPPPPPPNFDDPAATAQALEEWARQKENPETPTWKVRVDTSAKTPCPT